MYRLSSGPNITHGTTSNNVSLSDINEDLDTCDSNLRITVAAEVASIGLVMASETNPAFDPITGIYVHYRKSSCCTYVSHKTGIYLMDGIMHVQRPDFKICHSK